MSAIIQTLETLDLAFPRIDAAKRKEPAAVRAAFVDESRYRPHA